MKILFAMCRHTKDPWGQYVYTSIHSKPGRGSLRHIVMAGEWFFRAHLMGQLTVGAPSPPTPTTNLIKALNCVGPDMFKLWIYASNLLNSWTTYGKRCVITRLWLCQLELPNDLCNANWKDWQLSISSQNELNLTSVDNYNFVWEPNDSDIIVMEFCTIINMIWYCIVMKYLIVNTSF